MAMRFINIGSTTYNAASLTTGIDLTQLLRMGYSTMVDGKDQWGNIVNNFQTISPLEFFATMRSAVAVIRTLETENNDLNIVGTVDGVKVAGYDALLNGQLDFVNRLPDIVLGKNSQIIADGQAQKDSYNTSITNKKIEIESLKAAKRLAMASVNDLTNNYATIIAAKKAAITASLPTT
jgi:hypothetical protein